jgi:hypothetical protein
MKILVYARKQKPLPECFRPLHGAWRMGIQQDIILGQAKYWYIKGPKTTLHEKDLVSPVTGRWPFPGNTGRPAVRSESLSLGRNPASEGLGRYA